MNKSFCKLIVCLFLSISLSSCYTNTFMVGQGTQEGKKVQKKNHYVLWGLGPVGTADPKELAGGADDYTVKIQHSFLDGLITAVTAGIYTPTTTIVYK